MPSLHSGDFDNPDLTFSLSFFTFSVYKIDLEWNILHSPYGVKNAFRFPDHLDFDSVFPDYLWLAGFVQPLDGRITMFLIAEIVSIGLLIYLFIALLWPERFG